MKTKSLDRSKEPLKLRLAVGILVLVHPLLRGDIIPEYSQAAVTATAGIADFGAPQSQTSTDTQNVTLNPLNAAIEYSVVYPASAALLTGAACNPTAPNFCVSVGGQVGAQWTSTAHGTVSISNFGWNDHLSAAGTGPAVAGSNSLASSTPLFFYEFQADTTGTMTIDYAVSATGTDLNGIAPFLLNLAEQSGPFSAGQTPPANADTFGVADISSSGQASVAIVGGQYYAFAIGNESNQFGGFADRSARVDATFDFAIPSSAPTSVPEPSSLALLGSGLLGLGLARRWNPRR